MAQQQEAMMGQTDQENLYGDEYDEQQQYMEQMMDQ